MGRLLSGTLVGLALLAVAAPAPGMAIIAPPLANRVAVADCIVVGKVAKVDKTEAARAFPGATQKTAYKIAVVKITKHLLGAKGLTAIEVGFVPPPEFKGGVRPIRPIRRYPQVELKPGQEVCLLLNKHFEANFYTVGIYANVIPKNNALDGQVKQIKQLVSLLAHPKKSLQAKADADRLTTASMLMARYRQVKPGMKFPYKTKPIDQDESKLILTALLKADWSKPARFGQVAPAQVFFQLGLKAEDGWKPMPFRQPNDFPEAAKAWLKANAGKYRIQRYVAEKADKK
jgi:hypothetical protein